MLIIKMMPDANLVDENWTKNFSIITVGSQDRIDFLTQEFTYDRVPQAVMRITYADGHRDEFDIYGNVYVMNADGKTVSTYSPLKYTPPSA